MSNGQPVDHIEWFSDLVRLEIALWNRIDARLRKSHGLPLAWYWLLYAVRRSAGGSLRVGELAAELGLTVGGTSKIVDRLVREGLIRREPGESDRRVSTIFLSDAGKETLAAADSTCAAQMAQILDAACTLDEQRQVHRQLRDLLAVVRNEDSGAR